MPRVPASVVKRLSWRSQSLLKEFRECGEDLGLKNDGVRIEFPDAGSVDSGIVSADKFKHIFVIVRVKGGYYDGGVFRFEFDLRGVPDYPVKPPKVMCLTRCWHPNISPDGHVCHNYIQNNEAFGEGCGYSTALGLRGLILGIVTMFDIDSSHGSESFNANDPLNIPAARQFIDDPRAFERQAREYTRKYARE